MNFFKSKPDSAQIGRAPLVRRRSNARIDHNEVKDEQISPRIDRNEAKDERSSLKIDRNDVKNKWISSRIDRNEVKDEQISPRIDRNDAKDERSSPRIDRNEAKDERSSPRIDRNEAKDERRGVLRKPTRSISDENEGENRLREKAAHYEKMFAEAQETTERLYYEKCRVEECAHNLKDQLNDLIGQLNDLKIEKGNLLNMVQAREDALRTEGVTFENFTKLKDLQAQVDALMAKDDEQKAQITKLRLENQNLEQIFKEDGLKCDHVIEGFKKDYKAIQKQHRFEMQNREDLQNQKYAAIQADYSAKWENCERQNQALRSEHEEEVSHLKLANTKAAEETAALRLRLISVLQLQADTRDKQQREAATDKTWLLAQIQELETLQRLQNDGPKPASTKKPAAKLPTPPQSPSRDLDQAVNVISSTA